MEGGHLCHQGDHQDSRDRLRPPCAKAPACGFPPGADRFRPRGGRCRSGIRRGRWLMQEPGEASNPDASEQQSGGAGPVASDEEDRQGGTRAGSGRTGGNENGKANRGERAHERSTVAVRIQFGARSGDAASTVGAVFNMLASLRNRLPVPVRPRTVRPAAAVASTRRSLYDGPCMIQPRDGGTAWRHAPRVFADRFSPTETAGRIAVSRRATPLGLCLALDLLNARR